MNLETEAVALWDSMDDLDRLFSVEIMIYFADHPAACEVA
jgi:hypothetical protein